MVAQPRLATASDFSNTGEGSDDDRLVNCLFAHSSEVVANGVLKYAKGLRRVDSFSMNEKHLQYLVRFRAPLHAVKKLTLSLGYFAKYAETIEATLLTASEGISHDGFTFGPVTGANAKRVAALIRGHPNEAVLRYGPIKREEVLLFTSEPRCYAPIYGDDGTITLGAAPAVLYPFPRATEEIRPLVEPVRPSRIAVTPFITPSDAPTPYTL